MDKNLKKLSRVELLELMVGLSEDYERLAAENARLKQMLSQQRLPRSAKVGSIAEAALQANGYFESVQRSADEYLREIQHLRDELANRASYSNRAAEDNARAYMARAEQQAQAILRDAQVKANQIVSRANAQAQNMASQVSASPVQQRSGLPQTMHSPAMSAALPRINIDQPGYSQQRTTPSGMPLPDPAESGAIPQQTYPSGYQQQGYQQQGYRQQGYPQQQGYYPNYASQGGYR